MTEADAGRRQRSILLWIVAALVVLAPLGTTLFGQRVLLASDQLLELAPWRDTVPDDVETTEGSLSDTYDIWEPQRDLFADRLVDGDFALWNAYPSGGAPLAAEPSSGLFGASELPHLLLPGWFAPAIAKAAEMLAAVAFTYLFVRRLGAGREGALVAGVAFALCGSQVVWTNWPQSRVGALIPALFWATERILQERRWRDAVPLALVTAAILLEGFPSMVAFSLYTIVPYVAVRAALTLGRRWRDHLRTASVGVVGGVVGVGLATLQLLPFALRLGDLGLERDQSPSTHPPFDSLFTTVVPNAFGTPWDQNYALPATFVESQAFVGAAATALAVVALVRPASDHVARGARWLLAGVVVAWSVVIFQGGAVLELLQNLPVFADNPVGRARVLIGLGVAALAGIGVDSLLRTEGVRSRSRPWNAIVPVGVVGVAAALAVDLVARRVPPDRQREVLGLVLIATAAAAVALLLGLAARRWAGWTRVGACAGLLVLVAGEATLLLAGPFWPRIERDRYYPETPAHAFLEEHLAGERVATQALTLFPGTLMHYDMRSVTGHHFTQPSWEDMLLAADPDAFTLSPTFSTLAAASAGDPILDRLAASHFVLQEDAPPFGHLVEPVGSGSASVDPGGAALGQVPAGPLRGVVIELAERVTTTDPLARIHAEVIDPATGEVVVRGSRRVHGTLPPGTATVALAGEDLAAGARPWLIRVRWDADDGDLVLTGADGSGGVAIGRVLPAADGLALVFTDSAQIYERTRALPRVRWATDSVVDDDPDDRVERLQAGVEADTVVLSRPGPAPGGGGARLRVVDDELDRVEVEVEADTAGYLVLADSVQIGWEATVDGEATELREADHALGAVHVPEGTHRVTFRFAPEGWDLGRVVSAVSLVALAGLWCGPRLWDRLTVR